MHNVLLILLLIVTSFAQAQVVLKGKVVNEKTREPLAFVSIAVKNTNGGTTSDIDGKFEIILPSNSSTLLLSYVGFESRAISITNNSFLTITLKEKPTQLQEVVVHPNENP